MARFDGWQVEERPALRVNARGAPVTLVSRTAFAPERLSAVNNVLVNHI